MTLQVPDRLENHHATCSFDGLELVRVVRALSNGEPGTLGHAFPRAPRVGEDASTANRRGYVATFRLGPDGGLTLVRYEYPLAEPDRQVEEVGEELRGDFWLVLREASGGPAVRVPFVDGRIVDDQAKWRRQPARRSTEQSAGARATATAAVLLLALLAALGALASFG